MKMSKKLLIPAILILGLMISTGYGAYLSYKAYVEIYGEKYPLGILELDIGKLAPIEGLEAREDYLGEMRVWTYSDDAQLVVQLAQLSQIVTNFRSFTVKVCLPLDVIFVVDLTGSMSPFIEAVKAEMLELMWVLNTMNKCPNRFAVVGFYDYPWETVQNVDGLTYDYGQVETFIDGLAAGGGGGWPQSHYLGFERAKELFETAVDPSSFANDKIVVFIGDAPSGFNDLPEFTHAMNAAWALAEMGVKIHSVLCFNPDFPPADPTWPQYEYYALISNGNFVPAPLPACRFVPGVTSNPTWIVKLTPITPFDSFRLKLRSSEPTQKEGFYTFYIWVDFFCKAVPWHEFFVTELMANLEKAEIPPWLPPPPTPGPPPPPIGVSLTADPIRVAVGSDITFTWTIDSPPEVTPVGVTLDLYPPVGASFNIYAGTDLAGTETWTAAEPTGPWSATVTYEYMYEGVTYYAGAFASFTVE
jgi:hypothetical protein